MVRVLASRENYALPIKSRRDGLRIAQDVVLGNDEQQDSPVEDG
jgi:hypothetical protein